jgi:hypothetical protein
MAVFERAQTMSLGGLVVARPCQPPSGASCTRSWKGRARWATAPTMRQELSQGLLRQLLTRRFLVAPPKKWLGPVHIICAIHDNFYPVALDGKESQLWLHRTRRKTEFDRDAIET